MAMHFLYMSPEFIVGESLDAKSLTRRSSLFVNDF